MVAVKWNEIAAQASKQVEKTSAKRKWVAQDAMVPEMLLSVSQRPIAFEV